MQRRLGCVEEAPRRKRCPGFCGSSSSERHAARSSSSSSSLWCFGCSEEQRFDDSCAGETRYDDDDANWKWGIYVTVLDAIDDDDDDAPSSSFASRWRRRRNRLLACSKSFFFFATTTTTRRLFRSRGGRGFAGRRRRRRREECIIIIIFFFFFFFVERGSRRGSLQTDVRAERGETHRVRDLSKADRRFFGEQQRRTSHGGREGKAARKGEQRDDRHRRGGKETARYVVFTFLRKWSIVHLFSLCFCEHLYFTFCERWSS